MRDRNHSRISVRAEALEARVFLAPCQHQKSRSTGDHMKLTGLKPLLSAVLSALFCATIVNAAETEDRKKLVEAAQKEGGVVFYTSMDAGDARTLTEAFHKKYPAIKPDFFRAGREAVFSRFALEQKAGRFVTDVVSVGEFHMLEMKKQGLITRYLSPEMQAFAPDFKDPQGYWTCVY